MRKTVAAICLLTVGVLAPCALGVSGTSQIAQEEVLVDPGTAEIMGWPTGVTELVNDRSRTNGWNPWFSEWPNDVNHYEMHAATDQDLQRIIHKLAAIGTRPVVIKLNPAHEPSAVGFTTVLLEGNATPVLFSIGSQKIIDQWFSRLPDGRFGIHQFDEPPTAMPPTLTFFLAHPLFDLEALNFPVEIDIQADIANSFRESTPEDPRIHQIDQIIMEHKKRQEAESVAASQPQVNPSE